MENEAAQQIVADLTTRGSGVDADAEPLVFGPPQIRRQVPGVQWNGRIGQANAVIRMPSPDLWNGKLLIGGIPAVRTEYALDLFLSDIVLQRGYAYAACDKGTPGFTLRDTSRSMAEWETVYTALTEQALSMVKDNYGMAPQRTYIAGISNGGHVTRIMMERHAELFDGAVECEGVLWRRGSRHLLTTLPVYVKEYPIYCNWRGDQTKAERTKAYERLLEAGLAPKSAPFWDTYFMVYWIVSLWLYGRSVDPDWAPFAADWSNEWLHGASAIADYPWHERADILNQRIAPIENSGQLRRPMLSLAGDWDCLIAYPHHAAAYEALVKQQGCAANHRMYEIVGGNHVDGLLRAGRNSQQLMQPYMEAALMALENWVEQGVEPPVSGPYARIEAFTPDAEQLYSNLGRE